MANSRDTKILDAFADALSKSIEQSVNDIFDKHLESAAKEAEEKRSEIIAASSLKLSSWISYENLGTTLKITVEKPLTKEQN